MGGLVACNMSMMLLLLLCSISSTSVGDTEAKQKSDEMKHETEEAFQTGKEHAKDESSSWTNWAKDKISGGLGLKQQEDATEQAGDAMKKTKGGGQDDQTRGSMLGAGAGKCAREKAAEEAKGKTEEGSSKGKEKVEDPKGKTEEEEEEGEGREKVKEEKEKMKMEEEMRKAAKAYEEAMKKARESYERAEEHVAEKGEEMRKGSEAYEEAKKAAKETHDRAKEYITANYEAAKEKTVEFVDKVKQGAAGGGQYHNREEEL
ncbi:late embryogenesis abundant protein D-29 [Amborella trichopoda]|uniref:late embryogenesis abundant protein D-29 n=1 Tax=Amborella trichopoda TaxID=13333 RepID=UPI0009BDB79D|nr:late embryogenesis abundant protein D-29 [Amborella trichopoda]|eukprot:XP_020520584.1 late embryogenesis abundant protein D-29 [Amborella trichopoda]